MSTKHDSKCLKNAADDEPIFVLRSKDRYAPILVRLWADLLLTETGATESQKLKAKQAMVLSSNMEAYATMNGGAKVPD